jgi:hypothetical protein
LWRGISEALAVNSDKRRWASAITHCLGSSGLGSGMIYDRVWKPHVADEDGVASVRKESMEKRLDYARLITASLRVGPSGCGVGSDEQRLSCNFVWFARSSSINPTLRSQQHAQHPLSQVTSFR